MSFFNSLAAGYQNLRTAPQSAGDAIDKLCDRLANGQLVEDRRAALLGLKGLSRDWKGEVGQSAIPILLTMLERDCPEDMDTSKAVLETLNLLCEVDDPAEAAESGRTIKDPGAGLRNTDRFLAGETPLHALLVLLGQEPFYVRFFSLQLLGTLLANRPEPVQKYVLSAAGGCRRLCEVLDDKREIIRNEGLLLFISMLSTNADIQKIVTFEGAFDRLLNIIHSEGGITGGGIVAQDCLSGIIGLLRYNVSNQNYFRETSCIPQLAPLLQFPPQSVLASAKSGDQEQALQAFAFQDWPEQKAINAGMVLLLARTLVAGAGDGRTNNQKALLATGFTHCLFELALASAAPLLLKTQALHTLADILRSSFDNQDFMSSLYVSPLIPSQAAVSYEPGVPQHMRWQRAKPVPAALALVGCAIEGEPGAGDDFKDKDALRVRAAAVGVFESYVLGNPDAALNIVSVMTPPPQTGSDAPVQSAGSLLLSGLRNLPPSNPASAFDSHATVFSCLLFTHLIRNAEACKRVAREISFSMSDQVEDGSVDEDDKTSLVHAVVGNLMMAQREQGLSTGRGTTQVSPQEWNRVMVGYLMVLCVWMWESPKTVREFLSEGSNLQVLLQPISQASGVDSAVAGLSAFLIGILYEYNRESGTVTRAMLHPILHSRVGPDVFVNRILRLREDARFKNVGPEVLEMNDDEEPGLDDGIWFDWPFVEFLKNNYLSVQRCILLDPGSTTSASQIQDSQETLDLVQNLRTQITSQGRELESLQKKLVELSEEHEEERKTFGRENAALADQVKSLKSSLETIKADTTSSTETATLQAELESTKSTLASVRAELAAASPQIQSLTSELETVNSSLTAAHSDLASAETRKSDAEKEQEDLLVLLEELSAKRRGDKDKMRKAGLEVSDDEDDGDDDDDAGLA